MTLLDEIGKIAAKTLLVHDQVDSETRDNRLNTCLSCEKMQKEHMKCGMCGCYVEIKSGSMTNFNPKKGRNEITHCPLGRWGDLETANAYRKMDGLTVLLDNH